MNYLVWIKPVLVVFVFLTFTSCRSVPKKQDVVPSVTTIEVIKKLNDTKQALDEAGLDNTRVGLNIDKALTLAERLTLLLDKIENEQQKYQDKIVILPER
jgi:hypothetical protein